MMYTTLFWIIIAIVVFDFAFEKIIDYLNFKSLSPTLPEALKGIYDQKKYAKSQEYEKVTSRFSLLSSSFSFILIILMLFGGGFGLLDNFVRNITDNVYFSTLLFFGILGLASDILSMPFQVYSTFVIEERFGFNKTTPLTFVFDKLKSWGLGILLGGALISFILWAWISTGNWFWLIVFGGLSIFMVFMTMFYSRLIVPLFNKQTPLEEGELKSKIEKFSSGAGFHLDHVFVIAGSKRSTKANAYFSGLGPKKRVVLYDTLINDLKTDEIIAVLAHEIGHYKKKHIYKGLAFSFLQSALMIWLLSLAIDRPELSLALGGTESTFYMGIIAFGLLYSPISFFTGIVSNLLSRKYEYEADAFARQYNYGRQLIQGLIKLSVNNLSNLTPHPAYVFFHYSHPTLLQRKMEIEKA